MRRNHLSRTLRLQNLEDRTVCAVNVVVFENELYISGSSKVDNVVVYQLADTVTVTANNQKLGMFNTQDLDRIYADLGKGNDSFKITRDSPNPLALYVDCGPGRDIVTADWGDDEVNGGDGDDQAFLGSGSNQFYGGRGMDFALGGSDSDDFYGDDGNDILIGGEGDDGLYGGRGNDELIGNQGNNNFSGDEGNDTLRGGPDGDLMFGGTGNDLLLGVDGGDELYGGGGNDRLFGGNGEDILDGDGGKDILDGGDDDDQLFSVGTGGDVLIGGKGSDYFAVYYQARGTTVFGGDSFFFDDPNDHDVLYAEVAVRSTGIDEIREN